MMLGLALGCLTAVSVTAAILGFFLLVPNDDRAE